MSFNALLSEFGLGEAVGLIWGALGFLTISYALSRALRATQHGFSIRLQLFFTLFFASMMITTLIGVWALQRIEAKAVLLFDQRGFSAEVVEEFMRDFGAKTGLILGVISLICAGGAWALGRGIATPIEQLSEAAKRVSGGAEISSLPQPSGREVRRLRSAILAMHEALEDRRQFEGFIADLSHDLKNPVASIRASLEVLRSGAGEDPIEREHFLKRADEASDRLNRILSDFLGIARLEARGVRYDPLPLPISAPLLSSIRSASEVAEVHSVEFVLSYIDTEHHNEKRELSLESKGGLVEELTVLGSARWLSRAFDNLFSNAIRYSPRGGVVWVDFWTRGDQCLILVSDEGPGVSEAIQLHIFNRFISQANARLDDRDTSESTGLGLAIVKRIIEAHQGSARLISDPHEIEAMERRLTSGAQFLLRLPRASFT